MVGRNQRRAALPEDGVHGFADAFVHGLHRGLCGVEHAGVADHVAVRVVQDDHVVFPAVNPPEQLVRDEVGAHLRLKVVGGDFRGVNQRAVLAGVDGLDPAVEEERDVRVLFRLGDAQLLEPFGRDILGESVPELFGPERDGHVRHGGVVLRHADEMEREESLSALESLKIRVDERMGDFPRAVGPEVEENHRIAGLDAGAPAADGGHHELVRDALPVGILHGGQRVRRLHALAVHQGGVGFLHAVPAVVAVHRVIAARHGRNRADADFLHFFQAGGDVLPAGGRRDVAPVEKGVDEDLFAAALLRQPQQRVQVGVVAVDPAVRQKAHDVQGLPAGHGAVHRAGQGGVFIEAAVFHGFRDAGQLLVDDAAGADVGVPDFGVAHLPFGQAHGEARSADPGHRV